MPIGTTVYVGGTFTVSRDLTIDLTGVDILLATGFAEGSVAPAITSVVIDPGGANITMTADAERTPGISGAAGSRARDYRATGLTLTGNKIVRITGADGNGRLHLWATPCSGYSAASSAVYATSSNTFSASRSSATGQEVVAHVRAYAAPDTQVFTPSGGTTLVQRVTIAGGANNLPGAVLSAPGASTTTLTGSWSSFTQDWGVSMWSLTPTGDTTPPTLTSPAGTGGALSASAAVTTSEANGTLYTVFTASATAPTGVQVEAGQDHTGAASLRAVNQTVTATGNQPVASGGVTAGTRYAHFMHKDAAGNRSAVVSSASFVVASGSDTTPPTMTGTVTVTPSSTTASAVCPTASDNVAVTAYEASIDGGTTWPFTSSTPTISITGLSPSTPYTGRFRAKDAAGNVSTPVIVQGFTTTASSNPTITIPGLASWNNTPQGLLVVPNLVVVRRSDRVQVLVLTNVAADSSGNIVISNGALAVGVGYMVLGFTNDGLDSFRRPVTAV